MALAAGKWQHQQQQQPSSPTRPLDDLGDMAWLGSLVEPGDERPPAAAAAASTYVPNLPSDSCEL